MLEPHHLPLAVLCASLATCGALGCLEENVKLPEDICIYFKGTREYNSKVQAFRFTRDQAARLLAEHLRKKRLAGGGPDPRSVAIGHHVMIVDECYVFAMPDKLGYSLDGSYVNGNTGEITKKWGQGRVLPPESVRKKLLEVDRRGVFWIFDKEEQPSPSNGPRD